MNTFIRRGLSVALIVSSVVAVPALAAQDTTALKRAIDAAGSTEQRVELTRQLAERYRAEGRYRLALARLATIGGDGSAAEQASTQRLMGSVLIDVGRYEDAAEALFEADENRARLDAAERIALDLDLGRLSVVRNDLGSANDAFTAAILAADRANEPALEARARLNVIRLQIQRERIELLEERLASAEAAIDRVRGEEQVLLLLALGDLYERAAEELFEPALRADAWRALDRAERGSSSSLLDGYALGLRGALYEQEGRFDEALSLTRRALFEAQSVEADEQIYRWEWQLARLHAARGDLAAAEAAIERATDVLDLVRREFALGAGGVFAERIEPVYKAYADIKLTRAAALGSGSRKQALLTEVRDRLEALKQAEVEDYFADVCAAAPRDGDASRRLERGVAVLYPILLEDRVELLVETSEGLEQFSVTEANAARVRASALRLRPRLELGFEELRTRGDDHLEQAGELYEWIVAPAEALLGAQNVRTLVFVPEGALRNIPLSVLYDRGSSEYLVQRYAVVTTPSIRLTQQSSGPRADRVLLGGLSVAAGDFEALPNVDEEIRSIAARYSDSRASSYLDDRFILQTTTDQIETQPYSVVHLATHGKFEADYRNSFLQTFDGRLTLDTLQRTLRQRSGDEPIDLLVLSACETARDDPRAALGLAGVAVQAGVRSALASLWTIADATTVELMDTFYTELERADSTKAGSLRTAQIELINSELYGHPRYWAPYLLIGNWQ